MFMDREGVEVRKHAKNEANIKPYWSYMEHITWEKEQVFLAGHGA